MKTKYIKQIITILLIAIVYQFNAQETVKIPLTDATKAAHLKISIINGSISIKGTDTKEVIITGNKKESKTYYSGRKTSKNDTNGLKRISNNSLEFSAEEFDNTVQVRSSVNGTTDFEIEVPKNCSLQLSTINKGDIYVKNVNGAIEVSNTNGKITLQNVSGSVSADALNKDITVVFDEVTPNSSMAFSSLNGDIDVTFPKDFKADIKMKSERGEIYTDFDIQSKPSVSTVTKDKNEKGNAYRVKVEKWIIGTINGGGSDILFKNFNGDVIIRSK